MRKDLNLDSLNITVLLTSIEHEFTTVFEDRVFETVRNLDELVTILIRDPLVF
jgi:NADH dehydrogenase (ubiquinone) 1 alpha/beta subcomplex 1